jgi:hypothetical protein
MKGRVEEDKIKGEERERNRKRRRWKRKERRKIRTTVMKTGRFFPDGSDRVQLNFPCDINIIRLIV